VAIGGEPEAVGREMKCSTVPLATDDRSQADCGKDFVLDHEAVDGGISYAGPRAWRYHFTRYMWAMASGIPPWLQ
jgi:hypothetical protein